MQVSYFVSTAGSIAVYCYFLYTDRCTYKPSHFWCADDRNVPRPMLCHCRAPMACMSGAGPVTPVITFKSAAGLNSPMVCSDFSYKPWRTRMATNLQVSTSHFHLQLSGAWSARPFPTNPAWHHLAASALDTNSVCGMHALSLCGMDGAGWSLRAQRL